MNHEKTFKTKTGFCHILPDKIVLSRDGIVGNAAKLTVGNNITRILLVYGLISSWLLYSSYNSYLKEDIVYALLFGFMGFGLIIGILKSINNSASPIIERDKIKSVKFRKGIVNITRSRFEVMFENEKHQIKKRLIMLPGSMNNGANETIKALEIMKEEELLD